MRNIKSVFLGGKQIGANALRILVDKGVPPEFVVANLDDNGIDTWHESLVRIAHESGIKVITGKKVRDTEIIREIQKVEPEIIFCIGGMQIIPKELLDIPKLGVLNIHPALLPKYRGRFSTAHAIFNGEKFTGATVHWMDEGLDSGPIILQEKFPIDDGDTARSVYDKVTKVGSNLFIEFLEILNSERDIVAIPQDEKQATYYPKDLPGSGKLDWKWDGATINRFIRAMTFEPFPPPDFIFGEKKMVIIDERYFSGFKAENIDEDDQKTDK